MRHAFGARADREQTKPLPLVEGGGQELVHAPLQLLRFPQDGVIERHPAPDRRPERPARYAAVRRDGKDVDIGGKAVDRVGMRALGLDQEFL